MLLEPSKDFPARIDHLSAFDFSWPTSAAPYTMDIHSHLRRLETEYVGPAKQFLTESFRAYPTATTMAVIFTVTSFVPVVSAIALTGFASFVALAGILVVVVGLALSLAVVLSSTLVFSVVADFLVSGLFQSRSGGAPAQTTDAPATAPSATATDAPNISTCSIPLRRAFTALKTAITPLLSFDPLKFKSSSLRTHLLAFLLLRNTLARIFLPRWMRYHALYPYVFGSNRAPHPLKWVILDALSPRGVVSAVGVDGIVTAGVVVLLLSPRARAAALSFLRAALDSSEKTVHVDMPHPMAGPNTDAEEQLAGEETVPPVVAPGQSAATTGVSTSGGIVPEVRARNVTGAA
ncbi:hypothetical protein DFH06DRAFT_1214986 [Mycena polygramma]|nr:hypothetical protein DFH06DRAFT_1214986 [Mycena polygramma]